MREREGGAIKFYRMITLEQHKHFGGQTARPFPTQEWAVWHFYDNWCTKENATFFWSNRVNFLIKYCFSSTATTSKSSKELFSLLVWFIGLSINSVVLASLNLNIDTKVGFKVFHSTIVDMLKVSVNNIECI